MGYQSKTYSLSDEVVEAIETQRAKNISPDRYLWSLIFRQKKPSKRDLIIQERAKSDITAQATERDDIDYSDTETQPTTHVTRIATPRGRRELRPKGDKMR